MSRQIFPFSFAMLVVACSGADATAASAASSQNANALVTPDMVLSGSYAAINGTAPRGYFGNAVSVAGDLTGDGKADLVVTAPGTGIDNGVVYVFRGPVAAGTSTDLTAYATFVGIMPFGTAGGPQVGHADLNGDDKADLIIGAPGQDISLRGGRVYVFSGPIAPGVHGLNTANVRLDGWPGDVYGDYGIVAADFNGDGKDDLAIGAEGRNGAAGAVDIYFGPLYRGSTPRFQLIGTETGSTFGRHLTVADIDSDGAADLLVTAEESGRGGSESGADYLFYGSSMRSAIAHHEAQLSDVYADAVLFGGAYDLASTTAVADLNADGRKDILVGAPDYSVGRRGKLYVLYGGAQRFSGQYFLPDRAVKLAGEHEGDLNGWIVANAGDLDGDGFDDGLVSAICYGAASTCNPTAPVGILLRKFGPGVVYVLYSGHVATNGTHAISEFAKRLTGTEAKETAGFTVGDGADITGDGIPDVLIGAYCASTQGGLCNGRAYVVSGAQLR